MLAFISQYEVSIKYIKGSENEVADALSRQVCTIEESNHQQSTIGYSYKDDFIKAQESCEEMKKYIQPTNETIVNFHRRLTLPENTWNYETIRTWIPPTENLRAITHDGTWRHKSHTTFNLQTFRMAFDKKDDRTQNCVTCQKAKITHNKADIGTFQENSKTIHIIDRWVS